MNYVWVTVLLILKIVLGDDHVVVTPSGPVRGTTIKSYTGKDVDVFYGIPYAQPPVDNNRFGPPVEVEPWTEEVDATKPSLACYQRLPTNQMMSAMKKTAWIPMRPWSEDCLKVHIWVPRPRPQNVPVMINIHGGGFYAGDPTHALLSGATLAAEENVIVVTLNYRLNFFGFAYLGIPEAPGNAGLMDQQMAMRWVSKNIASFGGDPSAVTIFGLSAGGASVGYQVLAPSGRNLYKRAILMSGAPTAPWGVMSKESALKKTLNLAEEFDCSNEDRKKVLECLQSIHPEHFLDWMHGDWHFSDPKHFSPIVDGQFIPEDQSDLRNNIRQQDLSLMVGLSEDECGLFMKMIYPELFTEEDGALTPSKYKSGVSSTFEEYGDTTMKMLSFLYTNWSRPEDPYELRDGFKNMMSDMHFNCPAQEFSELFAPTGVPIYRYVVKYRAIIMPLPDWSGATHGGDMIFHSGLAAMENQMWTKEENDLTRIVMKWLANFARTGDPNSDDLDTVKWPKWTPSRQEHMNIDSKPSIGKNFRTEQCALLKSVLASTNPNARYTFIED